MNPTWWTSFLICYGKILTKNQNRFHLSTFRLMKIILYEEERQKANWIWWGESHNKWICKVFNCL